MKYTVNKNRSLTGLCTHKTLYTKSFIHDRFAVHVLRISSSSPHAHATVSVVRCSCWHWRCRNHYNFRVSVCNLCDGTRLARSTVCVYVAIMLRASIFYAPGPSLVLVLVLVLVIKRPESHRHRRRHQPTSAGCSRRCIGRGECVQTYHSISLRHSCACVRACAV